VFEQPDGATSWFEDCVKPVRELEGVHEVQFDQCEYGLKDPQNQKLFRKRTRVMTDCDEMKGLHVMCSQNHEHQRVEGQTRVGGKWVNRSRCAQVYPKALVEKIVRCYMKYKNNMAHEVLAAEALQEDRSDLERSVRRCHVNLGHPSRERFLHMLKTAGASNKAMEIAKRLRCSICEVHKPYPSHAVSKHKKAQGFNQQLNMDTFEVDIFQGKKLKMLNMFCEGTGLQVCCPLWKGATSKEVRSSYRKYWKRWAGNPVKVFTDGGTEFDGVVQQGFEDDGVYVEKSAAYSPWQTGYVERHGGIWKQIFHKAFSGSQPMNKKEVNELIDNVNVSKNSMMRKHGYAPYQHVFGCDLRIPISLCDENPNIPGNSGIVNGDEILVRAHQIRMSARRAMSDMDDDQKVRRALDHRPRTMRSQDLSVGAFVFYWRRYVTDGRAGMWRGPARVIGFYDGRSKVWISVGNKVLRCSPEQLRKLTDDQEAALRFVTADMVAARRALSDKGAHTFTDISTEEHPPAGQEHEPPEPAPGEHPHKRVRLEEPATGDVAPTIITDDLDEELTNPPTPGAESVQPTPTTPLDDSTEAPPSREMSQNLTLSVPTAAEASTTTSSSYGPIRQHEPASQLQEALRRGVDLLDVGNTRVARTPYEDPRVRTSSDASDALMCDLEDMFESFLVQQEKHKRDNELKNSDILEHEWEQVIQGKLREFEKLQRTKSIKVHVGIQAQQIRETVPKERFIGSRFVKTRRNSPDKPGESEIKCRWVLKGFQDPDILELHRQSPTLSADGLMVCLQLLASGKWELMIMDVEGAFLQGEPLNREQGKLYAEIPTEGIPGIPQGSVVELCKCVYGLMDAPRKWWESISSTLVALGMCQSQLDPCLFYWYNGEHDNALEGVIALHVDDMVTGGTKQFCDKILMKLRDKYPFKHWKRGKGEFLGRWLEQNHDGSITCQQLDYASKVESVFISRERRKQKDDLLTASELHQFRGVIGAANWLSGSTRPDIAAWTSLLQQRTSRATVADLIEANRLVGRIRDRKHTRVTIKSIPLEQSVITVTSDASWANCDDLSSQAAYMVMLSHRDLQDDKWADVSPLRWKSWKLDRRTQSTLGAELMGVSRALAEGDWIRSLFAEARRFDYQLSLDRKMRQDLPLILVTDNKPIYDHCQGDGVVVRDKRMAIDMLVIRADLKSQNIVLRWVDTRQMVVDSLTKISANPDFLYFVLKCGRFVCVAENVTLQLKAQERRERVLHSSKKGCVKRSHSGEDTS
jgi:IS30 family transposase